MPGFPTQSGRLTAAELTGRLRAVEALAAGKLRPALGGEDAKDQRHHAPARLLLRECMSSGAAELRLRPLLAPGRLHDWLKLSQIGELNLAAAQRYVMLNDN